MSILQYNITYKCNQSKLNLKQEQNDNFLKYFCVPVKDLLLDVPEEETARMG